MKVTIISATFNSAATIVDALRSIARQTYPSIEHIVIDGASADDTVALVKRHGSHVRCLVSEPDRGIYDAMNKGLALATGDYVGFLNSDDVLAADDTVEKIAAAATTGAEAIYGDLVYVRKNEPSKVVRHWRSGDFDLKQLRKGWMPPHPTFYASRSLIAAVGRFDTSLRIAADYDYMMRCLTRDRVAVAYVPDVLVRMRLGGISNSSVAGMLGKSREDLLVMRRYGLGGWLSLAAKNLRKLPQFR